MCEPTMIPVTALEAVQTIDELADERQEAIEVATTLPAKYGHALLHAVAAVNAEWVARRDFAEELLSADVPRSEAWDLAFGPVEDL